MARLARGDVFDPLEVSVFHCIHRCVRRCFLCGHDPLTGRDFEHRKAWMENRLRNLARHFGVDLLGFAIMSNHFHLVLRNRPDVVATWSDDEVALRWLGLCPLRRQEDGTPEQPTDAELARITGDAKRLAEIRIRLGDISWFMRMVAEPLARRANREDGVSGRFWEGRFRSVKLVDEAAILACCVYVDLNEVRAGMAATPEESQFTSARRRIEARQEASAAEPNTKERPSADAHLAPLPLYEQTTEPGPAPSDGPWRCSDRGFLPMSLDDYLALLDWTGRQMTPGKSGAIAAELAPILDRLDIATDDWLELAAHFGRLFNRVAGRPASVAWQRTRRGGRFRPGRAELLGSAAQLG